MTPLITRRNFLKTTTAAAAALAVPHITKGQTTIGGKSPNNRLNVAVIGVGGIGKTAVAGVKDENIVAFCDVDELNLSEALQNLGERYPEEASRFAGIPRFSDYRQMFDRIGNKIDAVTISTPDHSHFPIAMTAMALGKHLYLQKPLSHTVWEARELTRVAREKKVVSQMGNQGHAGEGCRLLREWVQSDVLGDVREIVSWTNRPFSPPWKQPLGSFQTPDHSKFIPVVPSTLNWDVWLGSTSSRAYDPAYLPGLKWRGWWDFGTGAFGDVGCHIMDGAYWALDLGAPTAVEATAAGVTAAATPSSAVVIMHFPARGSMPPVKYTWSDGGLIPPLPVELELNRKLAEQGGTLVFGSKAVVLASFYYESVRIIPEVKMREMASLLPPKTIPRVEGGSFAEWCRACKGGPVAGSNFEYSGPFTEAVLLGNVALRAQRRIEWDSVAMKVTNLPEANQFITKEYRPGWF